MKNVRFKLIADKEVESKLSESQTFTIEKSTPVKDPTRLGFDLKTISDIVTIISTVITAAKAAKELANLFRKAKVKKAVLQSPLRTIEVQENTISEDDLTDFFRGIGLS